MSDQQQPSGPTEGADGPPEYSVTDPTPQRPTPLRPMSPTPTDEAELSLASSQPIGSEAKKALQKSNKESENSCETSPITPDDAEFKVSIQRGSTVVHPSDVEAGTGIQVKEFKDEWPSPPPPNVELLPPPFQPLCPTCRPLHPPRRGSSLTPLISPPPAHHTSPHIPHLTSTCTSHLSSHPHLHITPLISPPPAHHTSPHIPHLIPTCTSHLSSHPHLHITPLISPPPAHDTSPHIPHLIPTCTSHLSSHLPWDRRQRRAGHSSRSSSPSAPAQLLIFRRFAPLPDLLPPPTYTTGECTQHGCADEKTGA